MSIKHPYMKNFVRTILIMLILLLITTISLFFINGHVKNTASKYIISPESTFENGQYDCILVLGCGLQPDGTPSSMLSDRLKRAVELYNAEVAPKIIMSGDHGKTNYDEVNAMRDYAIQQGVAQEDVFMDHAGFSTYESMYRARNIFCVKKMIVVTQKYHLYRATYIANSLGITAFGVDADYREYYGQQYRDLREIIARFKDFFNCMLKPEPTFLGETIPVTGNGTVTCD